MAIEVIMPKFGFTQETGQLLAWLKQEGDTVEMGDPIAEVTTDKVDMEIEAVEGGVLAGLRYKAGDMVPVATVIAHILKPGEALPGGPAIADPFLPPVAPPAATPQVTPLALRVAQELGVDLGLVAGSGPGGRITRGDVESFVGQAVRATPAARRLARETGVDLHHLAGSGPQGRVQGDDVRNAAATPASALQPVAASRPIPAPALQSSASDAMVQIAPMTAMRRTIAGRLQQSFQQAPHIFFDAEVDITALEALRCRSEQLPGAGKISLTALIVRATAWALLRHPYLNSQLDGDAIVLYKNVNMGIAVALENGLIVPVVHNAHSKSALQLAAEVNDLAERARNNRLTPDDVTGGTFTISNLGMFGVDRFTAIINPPQAAILAVSRAVKRFVPDENDQPALRPIMTITLSADHRIVDGALAARFLHDLRFGLEHPDVMIL